MAEAPYTPGIAREGEFGEGATAAGRIVNEASDLGTDLIAAVRDNAVALLDEQRDRAATEIAAAGALLRRSAQSLDEKSAVVARAASEAAEQIDDFASWLRDRTWAELAADVERFARRNPALFIGAAAALGFIAYRFVTAPGSSSGNSAGSMPLSAGGADTGQAQMVSSAVASGEFH